MLNFLYVRVFEVEFTVSAYKILALGQVVAQERFENVRRFFRVCGAYLYKPARGGVHRCLPHHLRLVFAKTLGALYRIFFALKSIEYLRFFLLVVGKVSLLAAVYFKKRRFRNVDLALFYERGQKPVKKRKEAKVLKSRT